MGDYQAHRVVLWREAKTAAVILTYIFTVGSVLCVFGLVVGLPNCHASVELMLKLRQTVYLGEELLNEELLDTPPS
jgi:uncharacterized membrane protein